tara:strand:- start:94 stop:390 length:297 start_codon:yes stop_codon:yes gene_type:complete
VERRIISEEDFFKRQEQYKQWFLNNKKDCNSNEIHCIEFRYWVDNVIYSLKNKNDGLWDYIDYQSHMIKIARQVMLHSGDIKEMEYELECYKMNLGVE